MDEDREKGLIGMDGAQHDPDVQEAADLSGRRADLGGGNRGTSNEPSRHAPVANGKPSSNTNGTGMGTIRRRSMAAVMPIEASLEPNYMLTVPAHGGLTFAVKRTCDIVISTAALILLAPILLVVCFLIKLDSSGPVLFRHTRIGRDGRTFRMLKFRTMVN